MSQHGCPERLSNRSKGFQEEAGQTTMEVLVETLTGTAFEMTVSPSDTVFAIKSKICRVEGIPVSQQHLVFGSRELEDGQCLGGCGVTAGARLRLVLALRGGPVSTRRLPAHQPPADFYTDIERLLHSNRDDGDWTCGSSSNCRVTVVVFRDGERVNMLRVRENDGEPSYSPAPPPPATAPLNTHCVSPAAPVPEEVPESCGGSGSGSGRYAVSHNAVTMAKMVELRRTMDSLALRTHHYGKGEIQKTRSEETLSVGALGGVGVDSGVGQRERSLPHLSGCGEGQGQGQGEGEIDELLAADTERLKLSGSLAGSILVAGRTRRERRDIPLVEPHMDIVGLGEQELIGGAPSSWRARTFGSTSQLSPSPVAPPPPPRPRPLPRPHPATPPHPAHARSASSLHVRAQPPVRHTPPLSDAVFSSSTSDLEQLRRNRVLPALSRHRNTEHLHLSDERLHLPAPSPPAPPAHPAHPAQRRIHNIAEMENSGLYRLGDYDTLTLDDNKDTPKPEPKEKQEENEKEKEKEGEIKEKKVRIRCGFCKKRLSIATVHRCRCGAQYCAPHRYAEVHGCAYDYKAGATRYLQRANPLVSAPKLPKI